MGRGQSRAIRFEAGEGAVAAAGYRKGEETRQRILNAALKAFGAAGLKGATTRQIAEDAGVNLPALPYYFGGKEGLYLACAQEIVGLYQRHMLKLLSGVSASLKAGMPRAAARSRLKEVFWALVDLQIGNHDSAIWMAFVLREISERGPAFAILYEHLWRPGVDITADLISRIAGEPARSQAAKIQALLLISSLSAFTIARPIALKYLDWPDTRDARLARIKKAIDQQIERIS
jgi:AcrR family transcriptional regulator